MNRGSFPISPSVSDLWCPFGFAVLCLSVKHGLTWQCSPTRHHSRPSDHLGRATKDSHFIHEGYGLGTFHMTLNRLFALYSVPITTRHLMASDDRGTNLRRHSDFDAWPILRRTKYTCRLHPPFREHGSIGSLLPISTRNHPLSADGSLRIKTPKPIDCWLLLEVTPRTFTSLSLPSVITEFHC